MINYKEKLIHSINFKNSVIGIIGLGYVGLPLAIRYSEAGYKVIGFDVNKQTVDFLKKEQSYIKHIPNESISRLKKQGFEATTSFSKVSTVDALIICVPTPLTKNREPDLSHIDNVMSALEPHLRAGQVISLESTTYPGTTEEKLLPRIEGKNFKVGENIFLIFSPEREDPGNIQFTTQTIPKICGGTTNSCLEVGMALYGNVINKVVAVSSTRAAELTKLLENIHRSVNIGLVNEMKIIADRMGLDIHEIIRAAATKPFGFVPYYPGPGLGGHCIPVDPFYLTWKAREYGFHTRFIELAGEVNASMPSYVVSKVISGLNSIKKSVNGSKVLLLGASYKKNIGDIRESPSLIILQKLRSLGSLISYSDPYVPTLGKPIELESITLNADSISSYDCILLATDHDDFDYSQIWINAKLIIDSRGRYTETSKKLIKA